MPPARLPFVVFLDVDKTLIGRAEGSVARFWLRRVVRELVEAGELPASAGPTPTDPRADMEPLLRPGVGDALRRIRNALGHVEYFVCSLGQQPVVAELKAPGIERAAGVRFRRPLFCVSTDDSCNCRSAASPDRKLVARCFARAVAELARRGYPALRNPSAAKRVYSERFFMVDDTPGVAFDDASNGRLVTCPPYMHTPFCDPLEGIPPRALLISVA